MEKELNSKNSYLKYPLIIFCGFGLGIASLMGKISPFGIALAGGMTGFDCLPAFLGAAMGYIMGGDFVSAVPSVAAAAAVCVLRMLFSRMKGTVAAAGSAAITGSAVLVAHTVTARNGSDVFFAFLFGSIAFLFCFTLISCSTRLKKGEKLVSGKPVNLLLMGITAIFMIAALTDLRLGIFNFGVILSGAATLTAAYRFRFSGGGAVGVICALGIAIGSSGLSLCAVCLAAGGITSALIASKGRAVTAAAFIFTCVGAGGILGMDRVMLTFAANMLVGSMVFMALPLNRIVNRFRPKSLSAERLAATEVFSGRLELVGNTMGELRYAVEKTAEALDESSDKDIASVYNSSCDMICRNCRFNMKCWGEEYNDSVRMMNGFIPILRCGERITPKNFTGLLGERCQRKQQLCSSINKKYDDFVSAGQMNRRVREMRGILTKQLELSEKLFKSIADEFSREVVYNAEASIKIQRLLERCGLISPKASAKICDGNMMIEAYGDGELACSAEELGDMLIEMLQREFDLPAVLEFGKRVRITAFERAEYGVKSSVCQYSRRKDSANGDYITACIDGKGCYYSIISDGMGSGTRARIDSAFACGLLTKLIESGIEPETAIDMLNTSLLVKSADESFATLDVCRVDLYTGRTTIFKAGGADTYVKSGKRVTKIKGNGLPVGVSRTLSLTAQSFDAGEDDVIIMTSDGAELSQQWIEQTFEKDSGKNMDELVKTIAGAARFNCEKGREDDISVVALQLKK